MSIHTRYKTCCGGVMTCVRLPSTSLVSLLFQYSHILVGRTRLCDRTRNTPTIGYCDAMTVRFDRRIPRKMERTFRGSVLFFQHDIRRRMRCIFTTTHLKFALTNYIWIDDLYYIFYLLTYFQYIFFSSLLF